MTNLQVYPATELPDTLKLQILSFLRMNAPEGFIGPNLTRDWITSEPETTKHVVITEGDTLIAHTEVKWRWLDHAGDQFKVYGLSGVLTYPAFRGRGFGAQVIREGTKLIRADDGDVGMLGCEAELERFYLAAGWEPIYNPNVLFGDRVKPRRYEGLLMMLFLSVKGVQQRSEFVEKPIYWGEDELW